MVQNLQHETDKKTREMLAQALSAAQTGEILDSAISDLAHLRQHLKDKQSINALASIENKLRSLHWDENSWESFRLYFSKVHTSFFSRLNQAYPSLTPGEIRICAFLVLNLNTKEIATLTNRSVRTIDTAKFHIRKKMNITKDTSILSVLLPFTEQEGA